MNSCPSFTAFTFSTTSAEETRQLGRQLGSLIQPPIVIALKGDLGAGKTTLTQGIAAGLGVDRRVTSPTFTLVNEYPLEKKWRLVHIDSYRLNSGEAETIGLEEVLDDERAIVIIEWAERVMALLPTERIEIELLAETEDEKRQIHIRASGAEAESIIQYLKSISAKHPNEP